MFHRYVLLPDKQRENHTISWYKLVETADREDQGGAKSLPRRRLEYNPLFLRIQDSMYVVLEGHFSKTSDLTTAAHIRSAICLEIK
jgi:hypothetical protein